MARLGRVATLVFMLLAALWAPQIAHFPGLFAYLQHAFAYVTPPLVAVFLLALWGRGIGASAALRALLTGHAISATAFVASAAGVFELHFTIVAGALCALTLLAAFVWQLRSGKGASVARTLPDAGRAPMSIRAGAAVVAVVVALMVWMLR
ncbi:MAG: Na+/glucose cotransporter, partial [Methyloversatilis sp.]|nr:Na+/glucose cotransporter [Methyloversatilis sp.]